MMNHVFARSRCLPCFHDSRTRLRAECLLVGRVAGLDRARLLVRLRSTNEVVIEVCGSGHQIKSHLLPFHVILSRGQNARWINVIVSRDVPLGVESAVGGQILESHVTSGRVFGITLHAIPLGFGIVDDVRLADQDQLPLDEARIYPISSPSPHYAAQYIFFSFLAASKSDKLTLAPLVRARYVDHPLLPLNLLVFSLEVAVTTLTCVADISSWETHTNAQKNDLYGVYVPYLVLGT
jgi:hypothetical protein